MKKFYLLLTFLVVGLSAKAAPAAAEGNFERRNYGDAFIFMERGVEFAVFPDGQFDFFFDPRGNFNRIPSHINYSFNSGYNYGAFVQYDDYGAVIQIEDVPVYYDYYGRIIQAGRVKLRYNAFGQLSRVGNMFVHYNPYNRFSHTSGFINRWNRGYVYRPWHDYYMRPYAEYVVVYNEPYRLYYHPNRMQFNAYKKYYHNNYYNNNSFQKSYYRPGEKVTSYQRGRRVEEPREVRKHVAPPRTGVSSNIRQEVYEQQREVRRTPASNNRADVNSRNARVEIPAVQQRVPQQRAEQRRTVRESRAANVPAQSNVQQESRRSSVTTSSAEVQARTPRMVRTERAATLEPPVEENKTVSTRGTRSSRSRD